MIWMIDSVVRDLHKDGVKSPMRGEALRDHPNSRNSSSDAAMGVKPMGG